MEQRERDVDERTLQETPRVDKYVRADFSAIVHDVLKNIWVAVLVGISAAFLAYVWAYVTYHPQYVSQTTFVVSAKGSNTGAYANLSQTQKLAEVFQTVLDSDVLKKLVAEQLGQDSFGGTVRVAIVPETNLLTVCPPSSLTYYSLIMGWLGIREMGYEQYEVTGLRLASDFMLGGQGKDFEISDPYDSSSTVSLYEDCTVHLVSTDERELPIIWEYSHGEGTVVVNNLNYFEKAYRGFYAASYSLLSDVCVYPVINASSFYLDDFPSPVPVGEGKLVTVLFEILVERLEVEATENVGDIFVELLAAVVGKRGRAQHGERHAQRGDDGGQYYFRSHAPPASEIIAENMVPRMGSESAKMINLPHITSLSATLSKPRSFTAPAVSSITYPAPTALNTVLTTEESMPVCSVNFLMKPRLAER